VSLPAQRTSITPGRVWLDTKGDRIHVHGGSVLHDDGVFYWYGENKERTVPGSGIWHWGVRCYRSTDLYNWDDLGLIIPPDPDDPSSPLHPAQMVDRPHILRHPRTGRYVCWLKVMMADGTQRSTVLVADALTGPYSMAHPPRFRWSRPSPTQLVAAPRSTSTVASVGAATWSRPSLQARPQE